MFHSYTSRPRALGQIAQCALCIDTQSFFVILCFWQLAAKGSCAMPKARVPRSSPMSATSTLPSLSSQCSADNVNVRSQYCCFHLSCGSTKPPVFLAAAAGAHQHSCKPETNSKTGCIYYILNRLRADSTTSKVESHGCLVQSRHGQNVPVNLKLPSRMHCCTGYSSET